MEAVNLNDENLVPLNKRTKSEQREIAQKAGQKSGEVRREKRRLREALESLLEKKDYYLKDKHGGSRVASGYELLAASMFQSASKGNVQAFKEIRDTIGEKPTEQIEIECSESQNLLKEYLEGAKNGNFIKRQEEKD